MSTARDNITQRRFADMAKIGLILAHTGDLASLWQISDRNLLHTTLSRYCKAGLLTRIYRGFYSVADIKKIHPWRLGASALHRYAYVSTWSILARDGVIFQQIQYVTFCSSVSRRFELAGQSYLSKRLAPRFLVQTIGINLVNGIFEATLERAVADLLYFNPKFYFDRPQVIDWKKVHEIEHTIGYPLTKRTS